MYIYTNYKIEDSDKVKNFFSCTYIYCKCQLMCI